MTTSRLYLHLEVASPDMVLWSWLVGLDWWVAEAETGWPLFSSSSRYDKSSRSSFANSIFASSANT